MPAPPRLGATRENMAQIMRATKKEALGMIPLLAHDNLEAQLADPKIVGTSFDIYNVAHGNTLRGGAVISSLQKKGMIVVHWDERPRNERGTMLKGRQGAAPIELTEKGARTLFAYAASHKMPVKPWVKRTIGEHETARHPDEPVAPLALEAHDSLETRKWVCRSCGSLAKWPHRTNCPEEGPIVTLEQSVRVPPPDDGETLRMRTATEPEPEVGEVTGPSHREQQLTELERELGFNHSRDTELGAELEQLARDIEDVKRERAVIRAAIDGIRARLAELYVEAL